LIDSHSVNLSDCIVQVFDVIDFCRDSLYNISDQVQVLDGVPCSVGDIESQIFEVEVRFSLLCSMHNLL